MTNLFLKAKHWQLFTLTFVLPIVFQIIMLIWMFSSLVNSPNPDPLFMLQYMKFFPIIMVLTLAVNFGWSWSVAIGLQLKVPQNVNMKVKKFKFFFFIPLIYLTLISIFFTTALNGLTSTNSETIAPIFAGVMLIIIPLHLFSIFCIFYTIYFVAKTFKTVELQKEVTFGEFIGEFFMIWFYFIGIWILQPKINKMVEKNNSPT